MKKAVYSHYILAIVPQTPIVLHIPHSRHEIPADVRAGIRLNDIDLRRELLRMTDWYTDELFDTGIGAPTIFPVSRLVADPERFENDADEPMSEKGMGLVYTRTSEGQMLRCLSPEDRISLINAYYGPHHGRLEKAVANNLRDFGKCLIIDCHSFSSMPLPHEPDQTVPRPEICLGTDPFHTPGDLALKLENAFRESGLAVKRNVPFEGTLVPSAYWRIDKRVSSIMIEVNRALYMDEATGRKAAQFKNVRLRLGKILGALSL